jgi:hypothetical protein
VSKFITNRDQLLRELLETSIPQSKQLDFLVGYFFFSGFHGIYKEIGDRNLRILVGMEADVDVRNAIRVSAAIEPGGLPSSRLKVRQAWYENQKNIISRADSLDTKDSFDSFRFFIEKLKAGTLEVKKPANRYTLKCMSLPTRMRITKGEIIPGKLLSVQAIFHFRDYRAEQK